MGGLSRLEGVELDPARDVLAARIDALLPDANEIPLACGATYRPVAGGVSIGSIPVAVIDALTDRLGVGEVGDVARDSLRRFGDQWRAGAGELALASVWRQDSDPGRPLYAQFIGCGPAFPTIRILLGGTLRGPEDRIELGSTGSGVTLGFQPRLSYSGRREGREWQRSGVELVFGKVAIDPLLAACSDLLGRTGGGRTHSEILYS